MQKHPYPMKAMFTKQKYESLSQAEQAYAEQEFVVHQLNNYCDTAKAQVEKSRKQLDEIIAKVVAGSTDTSLEITFTQKQRKWKIESDYVTTLEQTILQEMLKLAQMKGDIK